MDETVAAALAGAMAQVEHVEKAQPTAKAGALAPYVEAPQPTSLAGAMATALAGAGI